MVEIRDCQRLRFQGRMYMVRNVQGCQIDEI